MGQPLAMQMSVCHRHPVIMLYLCPMLFRRKPSGGRPVSCSLTAHWLHRPRRLLEARVMKADIASCLWAKAHGYVLRPRQGVGLRGIPFPQSRASGFGPSLLHPASEPVFHPESPISRPCPSLLHPASEPVFHPESPISRPCPSVLYPASRACLSSRKSHFTALSIGSLSRFQSLSFIPMAAFHGLVHRSSIPPRSLSFIPMAAFHGLVRRAVFKLVRYSSFSTILLSQMTQCGASGIAAHCIGHRSVVRWLLQRTAPSVPLWGRTVGSGVGERAHQAGATSSRA